MNSDLRGFSVCQLGARMHYAIPRLLHSARLLETFYTDISAQNGWPRALSWLPRRLQPGALRRLSSRHAEGVPARRIRAFTGFGLAYARRRAAARNSQERDAAYLWAGERFGELVWESGWRPAEGLFVFNTAGLELLQAAERAQTRRVMEQTIAPRSCEIELLQREHERFPEWETAPEPNEFTAKLVARERAEWAAAQTILCGSDFVRDQIAACGGPIERCLVVPYGVAPPPSLPVLRQDRGGPLRVLTVGAVGLRKGSPYVLAAAATLGARAEFRIVGAVSVSEPAAQSLRRQVELCGAVPRPEMAKHYEWADVFLLPSVCEGSATATYEALAAGLPIIVTPNAGSVVRNGEDGFLVPCGGVEEICQCLACLHEDRTLLRSLQARAIERSREFTLEKYGLRLLQALTGSPSQISAG